MVVDYISRALVADALAEWRGLLRARSTVSALRDLVATQAATIELRGSHPAGLASLFAGRATALSTLIREPEAFHAASVRAKAILDQAEHAHVATGSWTAALVVGTAVWDGREVPVLLRPIGLERLRDHDLLISLHPTVALNPVFATELRERGAGLELGPLVAATVAGKEFDPRPVWNAIRERADLFGGLEVRERLLLGAFDDPEQRLLDDLDALDPVIGVSDVIAAIAGDTEAKALIHEAFVRPSAADRDPFGERGVGDLDDAAFAALDVVAQGANLLIEAPPGADGVAFAIAAAADAAATGRSTLIVAGNESAAAHVGTALAEFTLGDLALQCTGSSWHAQARADLLASLTLAPPEVDEDSLRQIGEALVDARADLSERHEALHRPRRPWGASAYEAIQAIVRLTGQDPAPATTFRLSAQAAVPIAQHGVAAVAAAVIASVHGDDALEGLETITPYERESVPWWHRVAQSPEHGVTLDAALATVLALLPGLRSDAQVAHGASGLDEATSLAQWREHVRLFTEVRQTLDVFTPAIFHRSLTDMLAATAPSDAPAPGELPRRLKRAMVKRAEELLRPGRSTEGLHGHIARAADQATRWRDLTSTGGWPVIPDDFEAYATRIAAFDTAWDVIAPLLGSAAGLEDPENAPWTELTSALTVLSDGTYAGAEPHAGNPAGVDLAGIDLAGFIADCQERDASPAQIRVDLEFAWWASAFDAMVGAEPRLVEHGAYAKAVDTYLALDAAFGLRRVGPLARAAAEVRRRAIARHPQDARDLFAMLMEGAEVSVRDLRRDFGEVVAGLRPIVVTGPEQVSHVLPPSRCVDLLIVLGAESLATAQLIPALARAAQVVVVADPVSASRSAVTELARLLPALPLRALPQPRDPRVSIILGELGYGEALPAVPGPGVLPAGIEVIVVDAQAQPVLGSSLVESSRAEVAAVVERIARASATVPKRSMAVVAGSPLHAARIQEALEDKGQAAAAIPVVTLGEAAGLSASEVIISLGYARDLKGVLPASVGLLGTEAGRAALAQALLVGSESVTLVTALGSDDLLRIQDAMVTADQTVMIGEVAEAGDPEASGDGAGPGETTAERVVAHPTVIADTAELVALPNPRAIAALRHLIDASRHAALPPDKTTPGPSDWLLADIARLLRAEGYATRLRYGIGVQAIPLVVGESHDRDYRLAIVTDEQPSGPRATVRDRLRMSMRRLEALGWDVLPLFTLDMFMDPYGAVEAVKAALRGEGPAAPPPVADDALETDAGEAESDEADAVEADAVEAESDEANAVPAAGDDAAASDTPETPAAGDDAAASVTPEAPAAPKPLPVRPTSSSLIPTKAWEDEDAAWGERSSRSRDDEIKADRPPHW